MKKLIILSLIFLTGCSNQMLGVAKEWEKPGKEYLKLKAPKEKILYSETQRDMRLDKDGELRDFGDIKTYLYISTTTVPKHKTNIDGVEVDEVVERRTNNAVFFKKPKLLGATEATVGEEWEAHFYAGYQFHYDGGTWYQIETGTTTVSSFNDQIGTTTTMISKVLSFLHSKTAFATNYFPNAGDANVYRSDEATWVKAHDPASGTAILTSANANVGAWTFSNVFNAFRIFQNYDTSSIGEGSTITTSTLYIYGDSSNNQPGGTRTYGIYGSNATSSIGLLTFGRFTLATLTPTIIPGEAWKVSGYNGFGMNAAGLANIVATGTTKLAFMNTNYDIFNRGPANDTTRRYLGVFNSSAAGTSNDPYLSVTFTTAPTAVGGAGDIITFE